MDYKDHWEHSKERFKALWAGEIIDRCAVSILSPKNNTTYKPQPIPTNPRDLLSYWTDGEQILKRNLAVFESTYYGGDAFPQITFNLGAAGHASLFKGSNYQFGESVWFHPSINDWHKDPLIIDREAFLYKKRIELAHYFTSESQGRYFISMPDDSGNSDVLAHLRGSENLLMDMLVDKDNVHKALIEIQKAWLEMTTKMFNILSRNNENGSTIGWMNTWAPGKHGQMQCDISAMISTAMFKEFFIDELVEQSQWYDFSTYHLDGQEQISHLDELLAIKTLDMIQWTNVTGQPSPVHFIDVFKRIQASGKKLLLMINPTEIEPIMKEISSKGLYILTSASSELEANRILKQVNQLTRE